MTTHIAFTDLLRLIDDTMTTYLAAAQRYEFTEREAVEDLLSVVARRARDMLGKRKTVALVERVMAEDPRHEALPYDPHGVIAPLHAQLRNTVRRETGDRGSDDPAGR